MSESELVNPTQLSTKLEAILYLKAQPLSIQELADYAICEEEEVEEALLKLMQNYAQRNSALEVVEGNSGFSLQLREQYMSLVQTIVPTDLGVGALRTLAAIALKGPIAQTQLVELRGSGAYQHVGDLVEEGFVSKRRSGNGRSSKVQVTDKFYQYFEVDELPKLKLKKTARQRRVAEEDDSVQQQELAIADQTEMVDQPTPETTVEENITEPLSSQSDVQPEISSPEVIIPAQESSNEPIKSDSSSPEAAASDEVQQVSENQPAT